MFLPLGCGQSDSQSINTARKLSFENNQKVELFFKSGPSLAIPGLWKNDDSIIIKDISKVALILTFSLATFQKKIANPC